EFPLPARGVSATRPGSFRYPPGEFPLPARGVSATRPGSFDLLLYSIKIPNQTIGIIWLGSFFHLSKWKGKNGWMRNNGGG
ncbi:hypothetical protein, partial [Parabacteroides sp. An277]|uniref:hypothetical protein n=1 Tax=Parabacteroides sp. An277 TaxID=1965619 RepID=UPI001950764B